MTQNQNSDFGTEFLDKAIERGSEVFEKAEGQVRDLNGQILEAARTYGEVSIDTYEKSLAAILEYETKAAEATRLDFVTAVTGAHVGLVSGVSRAFTDAARTVLR